MKLHVTKHIRNYFLATAAFLILGTTLKAQDVASAQWPFSEDDVLITTDNITATGPVKGPKIDLFEYKDALKAYIVRPDSKDMYGPDSYIQFEITPGPNLHLFINHVSLTHNVIDNLDTPAQLIMWHSTSTEIPTFKQFEPGFDSPSNIITTTFPDVILVKEGKTVYIRIYFTFKVSTTSYLRLYDFSVSGYTTSSQLPIATISYENSSFCTGEGTAEVEFEGQSGGTFSSSPGLVIDPSTGSIDLTNSLPGDYVVSYSFFDEVAATTDITLFQPPECTISGREGPVRPSSELTFSAPDGMLLYSWSVTGATISGNNNDQTVTVRAGAENGSFTLSLTVEDDNGCTATCSTEIDVDETLGGLPTARLTGTQSVCTGGSADLVVNLTGEAPWTFTWTDGVNDFTVPETSDPQHVITVFPTENTTYSLKGTVTDGSGDLNDATGAARVYFGPVTTAPAIFACPNTTVEVPVTVELFREVRDISLRLKYDPNVMIYQDFENGDIAFGEEDTDAIQVSDIAYEDFRLITISKFSDENLPTLPDNAELLRLKFDYIGGNTELEWIDSPDDSWCSYSFMSAFDETGFETEAFCDVPTEAYYIDGSVKQLIVSGTDVKPIADVSTVTATPVIIPVSVTYPDLEAQGISTKILTNARLSYNGTGYFPAGARIYKVTCNDISVLSSPFDIGEKNEVLLSEILETAASSLINYSSQTVSWEFYIDGFTSPVNLPVTFETLAYTDLNGCVIVLDTESFNVTFADATLVVTESVAVCGTDPLQFTAEIGYPAISNLNTAIRADAKITVTNEFPEGTIIEWNYNSSINGSYTLPANASEIMLSTLVDTDPSPLQGHSGADLWAFEISNTGLMTDNEVTIEAVALLDGEYYTYSEDYIHLTVNPLPEVIEVSIQTSTDESTWAAATGTLSSGYYMCADPAEEFHYFAIEALTVSSELSSDFEKNAFYLDVTSVPAGFYEYWDAQGVNAGAADGWQAVMMDIISGLEPMFYIRFDGTDYKLIDGLQYQYSNAEGNLRINGDYPAGSYRFSGSVTDVNGCISEEIEVMLNLSSASVITCPADIEVNNDPGVCGAVVSFEATASGSPAPVITYTLDDGTPIEPGHFFPVGTETVTATAVNDFKTVSCTFDVTVIDNEAPVIDCPVSGNLDVLKNSSATYVHSGEEWDASATDNCSVENLSYTLSGATSGTGTSLDGIAFNMGTTTVTWNAADAAVNVSGCSYTVTVTGVDVSGTLKYYNKTGTPLDDATVTFLEPETGDVVATTKTNIDGHYSFASLSPGTYNVTIFTDKPMRSINSTDAGQVNSWSIAQSEYIWPTIEKIRFLAGNVNEDDYVDAGDAGIIQNYFLTLGTEVEFDKPWEFWKADDPVSTQPQTENVLQVEIPAESEGAIQHFYGLVSGDFDRSNVPAAGSMKSLLLKSARTDESSVTLIRGDTLFADADGTIELPVRAVSAMQVGAISLIFDFPTDRLQVLEVFLKDNQHQAAGYNVMNNMLIIGWNSVNPIAMEAGEPIFTLRLKMIGENTDKPVYLQLVPDPLNELADENMIAMDNASLIVDGLSMKETVTGTEITGSADLNLECYPNPFDAISTIRYSLPETGQVNLELTGLTGTRISILKNEQQPAGEHITRFNGAHLVPGIYNITLRLTDKNGQIKVTTTTLVKF